MDGLEIAYRRLSAQHLCGPPATDPVDVVRGLGCVQAQEYAVARWSLGQRTAGFVDADVRSLIDDGAILRTHVLRPTWHFVAAEDLGWIQALTAPRVHAVNGYYYRAHGLDEELTARSNAAITAALRGANHLTRNELGDALATAGLPATGDRLAYLVIRAELDALIASGPMRGKQLTYALVSERVPHSVALSGDEALAELTRRYFTSHGPATAKDFAWWSSLTLAQVRRGISLLTSALEHERVDGRDYYFAPGATVARDPAPSAHVLQGFDEYTVAYTESRDVLNLAGRDVGTPEGNLLIHPIILDSQMVGHWRRRVVARGGIVATVRLGIRLTAAQRRAVRAAFDRYAAFAGVPVTVAWP